ARYNAGRNPADTAHATEVKRARLLFRRCRMMAAVAPAAAAMAARVRRLAILVALQPREVLAGEDRLPPGQLVGALAGRGDGELEHRQRFGKIALPGEGLR